MALGVVLSLLACKPPPFAPDPAPPLPDGSSLFLQVQSPTGEPVPEARVRLAPDQRFETDDQGQLLLENLRPGTQLVQVEAEGYVSTSMNFTVDEGVQAGARIEFLPLGDPVATFNTSQGTQLNQRGVEFTINPGPLMDAQGRPIEGEVDVYLRVLDPDDEELRLAPGVQRGLLRPDLPPVGLESLGVMALVFKQKAPGPSSQAGGPGDVSVFARRIGIRGRVPGSIRASSIRVPQDSRRSALAADPRWQIPLWRWDTSSGYWVATGELGTFVESSTAPGTSDSWNLEVDNPPPVFNVAMPYSWRSPDVVPGNPLLHTPEQVAMETACLEVLVEAGGRPVAGQEVVVTGRDYVGLSRGLTNANGRVLLEVMRNKVVRVKVGDGSKEVNTGSAAVSCQGQENAAGKQGLEKATPQPEVEPTSVTIQVGAPLCVPGARMSCGYNGPEGTLGKGSCRAAQRSCNAEGMAWGECVGEVLPQVEEVCTSGLDDDCDGTINEGCASVCEEGETRRCDGPPDVGQCRAGTQTCVAGGTAWSACEGRVLPEPEDCSRPGDEDCDGVACLCWPGETQRCSYSGPASKEGVGECRAGTRTCEASGTAWSACTGEVLPLEQEDCTTAGDDNCDGEVNEGTVCLCAPGTSQSCYSGPAGTQGVGVCLAGSQTCNTSGTAWGACTNEVTPQTEVCSNTLDDDCDGLVNESPPCVWIVARSMASHREDHTATLLGNGKVLVTGGYSGHGAIQEAEVYDPGTNTWSSAGSMASPRSSHTATLLGNGKVLVVGGFSSGGYSGYLQTAEVYDPGTNTWSSAGSMASPRGLHTATLLGNGKVLVAGGSGSGYLQTAEVYDPGTNTWSSAGSMASPRGLHTATLLGNGKVLVAGGSSGSSALQTAEVYDPGTNTWSSASSMASPRGLHTATLLGNGKVLVAGGRSSSSALQTAEVYDPGTNTWSSAGSMTSPRIDHTATLLGNGKVLVAGGNGSGALQIAEVYDPGTNTWSSAGSMASHRYIHTATLLGNGKVLVVGGYSGGSALPSAEVYDPGTPTLSSIGSMASPRAGHIATLLDNGKVLVSGEGDGGSPTTAEEYDPDTNTWSSAGAMPSPPRIEHTATRLGNGKVLVSGGQNGSTVLDATQVYNPDTGTWSSISPMKSIRARHTATRLNNGKVLVAGGYNGNHDTHAFITSEVYDPDTGTWSWVGDMTRHRRKHTATLLSNGKVLVAGGWGHIPGDTNRYYLLAAEVYDPDAGTWSSVGSMTSRRNRHTATLLSDGRVLVTGGQNDDAQANNPAPLNSTEVYNPGTDTWSSAGSMSALRFDHTATLLSNGKVLVTGGCGASNAALKTAEVYTPGPGTWSSVSDMAAPRCGHTATLLSNGRVLVSGGHDGSGSALKTAEVYDPATNTWTPISSSLIHSMASPLTRQRPEQ
jgi:N-acetylneuraminic acid mutarotase